MGAFFEDEEFKRAYGAVLNLLARRPYSKAKLEEKLKKRKFSERAVEGTLKRASELKLIDDMRFALGFCENRLRNKPAGKIRLRRELLREGIDGVIADSALGNCFENFDERGKVEEIFRKRMNLYGSLPRKKALSRVYGYLARRGFSFDAISKAMNAYGEEEE